MRRFIVILSLLVLVVSAAAMASGGKQQEVTDKVKAELKKIDARLKLTPDQKTQIKGMLGEQVGKLDELYASIEPQEKAIRAEYRAKIREVLTPTQQAEWDKIKTEYKEKWNGKSEAATSNKSKK
jgi:Spy/CpxP family protein refolding chaperone